MYNFKNTIITGDVNKSLITFTSLNNFINKYVRKGKK